MRRLQGPEERRHREHRQYVASIVKAVEDAEPAAGEVSTVDVGVMGQHAAEDSGVVAYRTATAT